MIIATGRPTIQNPTPTPKSTGRQLKLEIAHTSNGSTMAPTAENVINTENARARCRTNQLPTVATNTINVPNDIPSASSNTEA